MIFDDFQTKLSNKVVTYKKIEEKKCTSSKTGIKEDTCWSLKVFLEFLRSGPTEKKHKNVNFGLLHPSTDHRCNNLHISDISYKSMFNYNEYIS